jgi:nickel-dependent lactate racemase
VDGELMKVRFCYDWADEVEVPDRRLIGVYEPKTFDGACDEDGAVAKGMAEPVGAARLCDAVGAAKRILILADDVSRPTPVARILPHVLRELEAAGKTESEISFLMSLGTHRPMTDGEIDRKLGARIRGRFVVRNHRWDDPSELVDMGRSGVGNRILVNRHVVESDFVIGIGNIVPHPAAGIAGGGKIVDPGCVSDETCGAFHWESVKYPARDVIGVRDNPMTAMIDEVAAEAGLKYIVNTVLDGRNRIARVVAGHPVEAHRDGCRTAVDIYGVRIPEPADIVLCDSHPADLEMWQAIKGLCTADLCLRDGGVVVMVTPCPEGASAEHPELERYGYRNFAETSELVNRGAVSMVVGHHMVQGGRLLDRAKRVVLVSNGLGRTMTERLRFAWAPSLTGAFAEATRLAGPQSRVTVLRNAAELFPLVGWRVVVSNAG